MIYFNVKETQYLVYSFFLFSLSSPIIHQSHGPGTPPASMATAMATSNQPVGYRTVTGQYPHPGGASSSSTVAPNAPVHQPQTPSVSFVCVRRERRGGREEGEGGREGEKEK